MGVSAPWVSRSLSKKHCAFSLLHLQCTRHRKIKSTPGIVIMRKTGGKKQAQRVREAALCLCLSFHSYLKNHGSFFSGYLRWPCRHCQAFWPTSTTPPTTSAAMPKPEKNAWYWPRDCSGVAARENCATMPAK